MKKTIYIFLLLILTLVLSSCGAETVAIDDCEWKMRSVMSNLLIGVLCMLFSLFLFFLSPKENKNMFGYKSPQQGFNKNIWKWSNKCFGLLAMIGSAIYLIIAVILAFLEIRKYDAMINRIGLVYVLICVIVTEIYTFILSRKKR